MKCRIYEDKGHLLLDEDNALQNKEILEHIRTCDECRALREESNTIMHLLEANAQMLEVQPGIELTRKTMQRIEGIHSFSAWKKIVYIAASLSAVAILITIAVYMTEEPANGALAWNSSIDRSLDDIDKRVILLQINEFSVSNNADIGKCSSPTLGSHIDKNICKIKEDIDELSF